MEPAGQLGQQTHVGTSRTARTPPQPRSARGRTSIAGDREGSALHGAGGEGHRSTLALLLWVQERSEAERRSPCDAPALGELSHNPTSSPLPSSSTWSSSVEPAQDCPAPESAGQSLPLAQWHTGGCLQEGGEEGGYVGIRGEGLLMPQPGLFQPGWEVDSHALLARSGGWGAGGQGGH